MNIQTQKGKDGENFINELACSSFLKYWCYPNPKDEKGDKKEICDLLIIFKNVLLIICVKNWEFKGKYDRYFRKTIEKDVKQVEGAERKLTNPNTDTFIKHPDRELEKLNKQSIKKVLRIVVHLGNDVQFYPLLDLSKKGKFVNIFDKDTFHTLVTELDTISDFVEYLEKREKIFKESDALILPKDEYDFDQETARQFFDHTAITDRLEKKHILISGSEKDLLAYYLISKRQFIKYLSSKQFNGLFLQIDGKWNEYIKNKQVHAKKKADKDSYFIDEFVKREILPTANPQSIKIAQELLSFNRFERRIIAKSFFDFFNRYKDSIGYKVARRFGEYNEIGIAFVFYSSDMKEEHVDATISIAMESFCLFNKYKIKKLILIATTNKFRQFKCCLMDKVVPFDGQREQAIIEDVKKLGWFRNLQLIKWNEKEYPEEK